MRKAFFFDQTRCIGCNSCTVACKDYYNTNPGPVRWRRHQTHEDLNSSGVFYSLVMACNHCKEPACKAACGAGAIEKRADGIVFVNRDKCQQLRSCITACPFAEPGIADDRQEPNRKDTWIVNHPMQKCNMCMELQDKGEKTVCERSCPVRAIEIGDYDELMRKHPCAVQLNRNDFSYAYDPDNKTETGPSLIIKPRKPLKVRGKVSEKTPE